MEIPTTTDKKIELISRSRDLLRGQWKSSAELKNLYKELEEWDQFAYATDVLLAKIKQDEKEGNPISLSEHQKLAKFIYKDHSLPSSFKFDRALQQLNAHDDLLETDKCETLGLAGAIHKYKWLYDHQSKNLELSLYYYGRGLNSWQEYLKTSFDERMKNEREERIGKRKKNLLNDDGYTAVNYAYILELMAIDKLEAIGQTIDISKTIESQIEEANAVRNFILDQFIKDRKSDSLELNRDDYDSWVVATVAEAYFGLRDYSAALKFIGEYKQREKTDVLNANASIQEEEKIVAWKIRTFSRQLFSIAYLQNIELDWVKKAVGQEQIKQRVIKGINQDDIKRCLQALTTSANDTAAEIEVQQEGKVGLALSGGGFRASLFHIGVLAALAERDKLKDIEVLSCVSGGSILGTFYYLMLKQQQTEKGDSLIASDYIGLVKDVEELFLKGVQKNLRVRVLSNLWCNMKMIFSKNYSRTNRLGELYEKHFYSKVLKKDNDDPIYMSDLFINPKDKPKGFDISTDNWKRRNKIPQLILNATSVNTGHNWQFTASWMGEPPGSIQSDIDVKPRLRRMYYDDAPKKYKKFRLGYAVGASSCVPVMFEPMPMHDLYPVDPSDRTNKKKIELQLVDGGLHDNQGIASLIEQECKNMIISDASGQMATTTEMTGSAFSVFYRADTILQERIRELQFKDVKERAYTTELNSLISVHLKSDLQQMPISWMYCTDPPRTVYDENWCEDANELTSYGVLRGVQQMLSEIRTDLDSFNDTEAYALMYSGYAQTHQQFKMKKEKDPEKTGDWNFLKISKHLTLPENSKEIEKILATAKRVPFKLFHLSLMLRIAAITAIVVVAAFLLLTSIQYWDYPLVRVNTLVYALIIILVGLVSKLIAFLLSYKSEIRKKVILIVIMLAGWVVSNLYLLFLNGIYNRFGKVK
ncbi:MAG: patatin-like phospholipase family protein [Chryseolinea sp.]